MTPVEMTSCDMLCPMPGCGRIDAAIRNGSVYQDSSAWCTAWLCGAWSNLTQTFSSGSPVTSVVIRSTPSTIRTCEPPSGHPRASASAGPATSGMGRLCRIRSGSPASSRSSPRLSSRSPCRAVTVTLASARPACMTSTSRSTGSFTVPARAKIACSDLTFLSGSVAAAATIICPMSCPPNTTGRKSEGTLGPRNRFSPAFSSISEFRMG